MPISICSAAGHRPQNFYMLGRKASPGLIALGVALAQPERGVIALEGDGSILMSLGCLATIANMKPQNLTIVIWDNGVYQITGKQQAATAGMTDIAAVARVPALPLANGSDEAHWKTARPPLQRRRADSAGGEDRRSGRKRPNAARPAAHPPPLHERLPGTGCSATLET